MHAGFMGLLRGFIRRLLRREWSSLARTTKATRTGRRLRDQVSFKIRDRDHRVIERRGNVHDAVGNVLLLFLAKDLLFSACFSHNFSVKQSKLFLAGRLLLGDSGASWSFARARIRVGTLATHRQRTTMSQTAIAADVHQTLDVHLNALAQVALDLSLRFQNVTDAAQFVFTQISNARVEIDTRFLEHRIRARTADAVDVCETNLGSLVGR